MYGTLEYATGDLASYDRSRARLPPEGAAGPRQTLLHLSMRHNPCSYAHIDMQPEVLFGLYHAHAVFAQAMEENKALRVFEVRPRSPRQGQ